MPHAIARGDGPRRRVVVIGGGPAGLEAARVSAARGHDVVLLEATDRLGGQVNLAARLDRRREILGITGWLQREVELAGVDVRFNSYAESDDVLALDAGHRRRRDRRHAQCRLLRRGCGSRRQRLGRAVRADRAHRRYSGLRRERPASGPERRRVPGGAGRQGDLRGARPDAGGGAGGHQLVAVHEGALRGWRPLRAGSGPQERAARGQPAGGHLAEHVHRAPRGAGRRPHRGRARHPAGGRAVPRAQGAARATMARSTSMPSWPAGRRGSTPTRPGATSCSGSATRWPAATSMRRSTIRCGSARISEATEG